MLLDSLNAELLCCLRRNIANVLRLPQRRIAVLSPEKYYQCSQTASTPNCCVVSGKIRPVFSDCVLMYKIERQLEFPAGMNKVYCYCCYLLSIFVTAHWAVQAGLLTPLTFARDLLSFLVAFTSGAYFLHSGRWWQRICEFYTANFKDIFWGPYSECFWQQAKTCCSCYRMPQNVPTPTPTHLPPRTLDLLVSQKT